MGCRDVLGEIYAKNKTSCRNTLNFMEQRIQSGNLPSASSDRRWGLPACVRVREFSLCCSVSSSAEPRLVRAQGWSNKTTKLRPKKLYTVWFKEFLHRENRVLTVKQTQGLRSAPVSSEPAPTLGTTPATASPSKPPTTGRGGGQRTQGDPTGLLFLWPMTQLRKALPAQRSWCSHRNPGNPAITLLTTRFVF